MPSQPFFAPRALGDQRPRIIAIDWGTTSLRGVLINADGVIAEHRALPHGILQVTPGNFAADFAQHFGDWLALQPSLCLLSGMVGSRQGWQEAAYCPCPANFDALRSQLLWLENTHGVPTAIVPGMSITPQAQVDAVDGVPDVMRGEEIQVIGALRLMQQSDGLLVLPGTHSKWVQAVGNAITSFKTFMTGELFALLAPTFHPGQNARQQRATRRSRFCTRPTARTQPRCLEPFVVWHAHPQLVQRLEPCAVGQLLIRPVDWARNCHHATSCRQPRCADWITCAAATLHLGLATRWLYDSSLWR